MLIPGTPGRTIWVFTCESCQVRTEFVNLATSPAPGSVHCWRCGRFVKQAPREHVSFPSRFTTLILEDLEKHPMSAAELAVPLPF